MRPGHRWFSPKKLTWLLFCWRCGLVNLNNQATAKAIAKGCHPDEEE